MSELILNIFNKNELDEIPYPFTLIFISDAQHSKPKVNVELMVVSIQLADFSDELAPLSNTVPSLSQFQQLLVKYAIDFSLPVVFLDDGIYTAAARIAWIFILYGHRNVSLVQEGTINNLKNLKHGYNINGLALRNHYLTGLGDLLDNLESKQYKVLDARSALRFAGQGNEGPGVTRLGHIPGSINLPITQLFDAKNQLLSAQQLRDHLYSLGVFPQDSIVTTCGSGITAALLALVLESVGYHNWSLYDGGWQEWSRSNLTPVDTLDADGIYR